MPGTPPLKFHPRSVRALTAVLLLGSDCSFESTVGPGVGTVGFSFTYADSTGRRLSFSADSGSWSLDAATSTVYTNLYATAPPDLGTPLQFQFYNSLAAPVPHTLPTGVYAIGDTLTFAIRMEALSPGHRAFADSGAISISRNDLTHLEGSLDVYMSHPDPSDPGAPFHLTGPFRLMYRAAGT